MVAGLIQYKVGAARLGDAGSLKTDDPPEVLQQKSRYAASFSTHLVVVRQFLG